MKITMGKRKKYAKVFKQDVLGMASRPDESITQLGRDLGITPGLIYIWRERYRVEQDGHLKPTEERAAEAEICRLKCEQKIARQE